MSKGWRETISETAKKAKLPVKMLLALSPGNDPFFVGSPSQIRLAVWFQRNWTPLRTRELHLRGIHYALVGSAQDWNGRPYDNTDRNWNTLVEAAKYARYLGLIPFDAIPDHKAAPPILNAYYYDHGDSKPDIESLRNKVLREARFEPFNPYLVLPYHQEVWIEKTSLENVLGPICRRYGANLIQGEGQLSVTSVNLFMRRLRESGKPGRVYYVCDFDPQGDSMPTAVARKIEFFNRSVLEAGLDAKLKWLALSREQVIEHELPRTPIKESDMGRVGFEQRYGEGATELDALHARHPGVIENMVTRELSDHFDAEAWNAYVRENQRLDAELKRRLRVALKSLKWDVKPRDLPDGREPDPDDDGDPSD